MIRFGVFYLFFLCICDLSCQKRGCTDPNADNFEASAEKDNGKCGYHAGLVFWYDEAKSIYFQDTLMTSVIKLFIDSSFMSNYDASLFWSSAPDCLDSDIVGVYFLSNDSGHVSNLKNWEFRDQNDAHIESGVSDLIVGECVEIQL